LTPLRKPILVERVRHSSAPARLSGFVVAEHAP
jgi:hypothetical protein